MSYEIVDLSYFMGDFLFPGNPSFTVAGPFNRVRGNNPEFVYDFTMCSQTGTHIQGPHYFLEDGKRIEKFALSDFEGEAIIIDLDKRGIDTTREDLIKLLGNDSAEDKILVLRSGNMEEIIKAGSADPAQRPGLSMDAAQYLAEEQCVRMIAIDSIGIESRITKNFEVNKYVCSKEILLLEGLVNLKAIKKRHFFLEAFPLKISGVEGTPCRALAKVPID